MFMRMEQRLTKPNFETHHVMAVDFVRNKAPRGTPSSLVLAIESLPQVRSISFSSSMPADQSGSTLEFMQFPELDRGIIRSASVTPAYFRTLDIPIVAGRSLEETDVERTTAPKPIVVSQQFVRQFYPDSNPIGRILKAGSLALDPRYQDSVEIVGVAPDMTFGGVPLADGRLVYTLKAPSLGGYMLIRFNGDSGAFAAALQSVVRRE